MGVNDEVIPPLSTTTAITPIKVAMEHATQTLKHVVLNAQNKKMERVIKQQSLLLTVKRERNENVVRQTTNAFKNGVAMSATQTNGMDLPTMAIITIDMDEKRKRMLLI